MSLERRFSFQIEGDDDLPPERIRQLERLAAVYHTAAFHFCKSPHFDLHRIRYSTTSNVGRTSSASHSGARFVQGQWTCANRAMRQKCSRQQVMPQCDLFGIIAGTCATFAKDSPKPAWARATALGGAVYIVKSQVSTLFGQRDFCPRRMIKGNLRTKETRLANRRGFCLA